MLRLDKMQTTDKDTHQYIHVQFRLITLSKPFCFFFVCSFLHFITVTNKTSIGVKGNTSKIMTKENESQKKKILKVLVKCSGRFGYFTIKSWFWSDSQHHGRAFLSRRLNDWTDFGFCFVCCCEEQGFPEMEAALSIA